MKHMQTGANVFWHLVEADEYKLNPFTTTWFSDGHVATGMFHVAGCGSISHLETPGLSWYRLVDVSEEMVKAIWEAECARQARNVKYRRFEFCMRCCAKRGKKLVAA